jgi:UPF0755 protein
MRVKFLTVLFVIALFVTAGAAYYLVTTPIGPPAGTSEANSTYVDIGPGTGTRAIAAQLEQAGVLRSRYAFELLRIVKGGKLEAGEYRFDHPAPATEVYARIVRGDVYTRTLTIPEGYNIFDIASAIEAAGFGDRADFLAAERTQTALIADLSPHAASLEGFLFPDTYRFPTRATAAQILAAMVHRFRQVSVELSLPADPLRTVILASLIEKEVSQDAERPLVAGVFANRIDRNMPLATDPSVVYAALLEGRYRGAIYASDLKSPSRYNTYVHTGLPPGPIANPGVAALKAALAPAQTDYLYFVADAQGHSRFSATLKQHDEQVQEYRRATEQPVAPVVRKPSRPNKTKPRVPAGV